MFSTCTKAAYHDDLKLLSLVQNRDVSAESGIAWDRSGMWQKHGDPRPHWSSAKSPIGELLRMTATDPIQDGDRTNLTKYIKYIKICLSPKV